MNDKIDRRRGRVPSTKQTTRNEAILAMAQEGWGFEAIAQAHGISRERVSQICRALGYSRKGFITQPAQNRSTVKQVELYRFIVDYKAAHGGVGPTLGAIVAGTSYKGKSGVFHALRSLESQGKIVLVKGAGGKVAGIEVVGAQWVPPAPVAPAGVAIALPAPSLPGRPLAPEPMELESWG